MKSPIKHTLWTDCLFQRMKEAQERGDENIEFSDVDDLVIEKSCRITKWEEDDGEKETQET